MSGNVQLDGLIDSDGTGTNTFAGTVDAVNYKVNGGQGSDGIGYGKGSEVPLAIQKAIENAKKNVQEIPMAGTTIVHTIIGKHGSSRVLLKPAAPGTGVIAGGAARQVLEVAFHLNSHIKDVWHK